MHYALNMTKIELKMSSVRGRVMRGRTPAVWHGRYAMTAGNQAEITMPTSSSAPVNCTFVVDDGHRDDGTPDGYWVDGGCHMELT
jgi:hypothetical protein